MSGEKDLNNLIKNMSPILNESEYVFLTVKGEYGDFAHLNPLCTYMEKEGLTLIVPRTLADKNSMEFSGTYKAITLEVHSSLDAVGLTAAVASKLANDGISANVVAAFYHDHIFVQTQVANDAIESLRKLIKYHLER